MLVGAPNNDGVLVQLQVLRGLQQSGDHSVGLGGQLPVRRDDEDAQA